MHNQKKNATTIEDKLFKKIERLNGSSVFISIATQSK